ncbi:MAG: glutamate--tRNA ligase [Patescibacteria group bacterium]|nr:glutamate--tRNA ligase [Patescibacteria group bacterium]
MQKEKVITRMAPSPTGLFHIGSVRTALFNYLFAKSNGGKFILRIEDTDPKRSKKEYEEDILEGMKWLGLKWNSITKNPSTSLGAGEKLKAGETFYRQSERLPIYQKYSDQLIKSGKAYKKEGAIWFKLDSYPKDSIKYPDLIMGELEFKKENFHDFVIIKSDGVPLYMFAATVDDYEMGVTHVIRGADHVNSTPQQIMLYESLNFTLPKFAHIPLILNPDRSKMSKRHNPVSVSHDFRDQGYLPEAMINYIALLGWNPKDNREFFTLKDLEKEFDLAKVNRSGAIFDIEKLNYFNNYYINKLSDDNLSTKIEKLKTKNQNLKLKTNREVTLRIISVIKSRMNKLADFEKLAHYFYKLPEYEGKLLVFKKSTPEATLEGLAVVSNQLSVISSSDWGKVESLNKTLLDIVAKESLTNGDVFWPVRVALSGQEKSPSPVELLWALGKEESIKRIKLALDKLRKVK